MRLLKLFALLASLAAAAAAGAQADPGPPWGPETPNFNLEAILRPTAIGPEKGFGLVKFRQPNDQETRIYLDVWVRDLAPDRTYYLRRAVDMTAPDGDCDSESGWLTLGPIPTDGRGTGQAALSRAVPAVFRAFDIHFIVTETETATSGVLQSACYQYTVSQ
jgi:hypothetical protein